MPTSDATMNLGYGLIGAFSFVFIGSAVSMHFVSTMERLWLTI